MTFKEVRFGEFFVLEDDFTEGKNPIRVYIKIGEERVINLASKQENRFSPNNKVRIINFDK